MTDPIQKIRYLLRQKFDAHIAGIDRQGIFILRTKDSAQRARIEKEIQEYTKELSKTSFEELEKLYNNALAETLKKEQETQQRQKEQWESEIKEFFTKPELRPNYEHWSRMAYWKIEEAIALTVNFDPFIMNEPNLPRHLRGALYRAIKDLKEVVNRAVMARQLYDPIKPAKYIEWIKHNEIDFPKRLEALIIKRNSKKEVYSKKSLEKPLGTRERETLLKLIIGMAVAGYRYNPKAGKNNAVSEIVGDLDKLGIAVSDDTVRKKLEEAKDFLPQEP